MSENNESHLVAGRECGDCTACCVVLHIDDDNFKKPADQVCENLMEKGGCKIYTQRPSVCQDWHCAWRFMAQLDESWRPDISGIMLRSDENGIIFQPISDPKTVLITAQAIELIGGGVAQGIAMSMSIPIRKGYRSYSTQLNEPLKAAVDALSLAMIQDKMLELIEFSLAQNTAIIPSIEG